MDRAKTPNEIMYELFDNAGHSAATQNMRRAGRTSFNEEDHFIAKRVSLGTAVFEGFAGVEVYEKLIGEPFGYEQHEDGAWHKV